MNKGEYENRLAGFSAMDKNKLAEYAVNCEAHIEALVDERDAALEREQALAAHVERLQAEAYKAGWDASGEGWNAEYPGDAHRTAQWEGERDEWIRQQAAAL